MPTDAMQVTNLQTAIEARDTEVATLKSQVRFWPPSCAHRVCLPVLRSACEGTKGEWQPLQATNLQTTLEARDTEVKALKLQVRFFSPAYYGPRQTGTPFPRTKADVATRQTGTLFQCGFARHRALLGSLLDEGRNSTARGNGTRLVAGATTERGWHMQVTTLSEMLTDLPQEVRPVASNSQPPPVCSARLTDRGATYYDRRHVNLRWWGA